jgi:hypothetical protein
MPARPLRDGRRDEDSDRRRCAPLQCATSEQCREAHPDERGAQADGVGEGAEGEGEDAERRPAKHEQRLHPAVELFSGAPLARCSRPTSSDASATRAGAVRLNAAPCNIDEITRIASVRRSVNRATATIAVDTHRMVIATRITRRFGNRSAATPAMGVIDNMGTPMASMVMPSALLRPVSSNAR